MKYSVTSTSRNDAGSRGLAGRREKSYPTKLTPPASHGPIKSKDFGSNGQSAWPAADTSFPNHA